VTEINDGDAAVTSLQETRLSSRVFQADNERSFLPEKAVDTLTTIHLKKFRQPLTTT
jgi:hypothetical protein